MWKDLPIIFNNSKILNTGFGRSKASDLLYFIQELILDYNPSKVIIYEGDNDVSGGQNTHVILISAKPSISRWHLRQKHIELNNKYKNLALKRDYIHFADTWSKMLDSGELKTNIFISDGLHLNQKGYKIRENVLRPILKNSN